MVPAILPPIKIYTSLPVADRAKVHFSYASAHLSLPWSVTMTAGDIWFVQEREAEEELSNKGSTVFLGPVEV